MNLNRIIKHTWVKDDEGYHCEKCGYKRTFNPNIDYTGGNIPFPLTGYANMNMHEELYGECLDKKEIEK